MRQGTIILLTVVGIVVLSGAVAGMNLADGYVSPFSKKRATGTGTFSAENAFPREYVFSSSFLLLTAGISGKIAHHRIRTGTFSGSIQMIQPYTGVKSGKTRPQGSRGPEIRLHLKNKPAQRGWLASVDRDSLTLAFKQTRGGIKRGKFPIKDLQQVVLIKRGNLKRVAGWAMGATVAGMAIGFISGDDPPGFLSFTAEQKAFLLGILGGGSTAFFLGSYEILKSVDVSIPLSDKSPAEKSAILKKLRSRQYRSKPGGSVSVKWQSMWIRNATLEGMGYAFRLFFRPRAAIEISRYSTEWSPFFTNRVEYPYHRMTVRERNRYSRTALCAVVYLKNHVPLRPWISWGLAFGKTRRFQQTTLENFDTNKNEWVTETMTSEWDETFLTFPLRVGADLRIFHSLYLEAMAEKPLAGEHPPNLRFELGCTLQF